MIISRLKIFVHLLKEFQLVWVAFVRFISTQIGTLSPFSINQPLFLQNKTKPLGLGFDFGPQRIRSLAIVFVVRAFTQQFVTKKCLLLAYCILNHISILQNEKRLYNSWMKNCDSDHSEWVEISYDRTFCSAFLFSVLCIFVKFILLTGFRNYFQEFANLVICNWSKNS